MGYQIKALNTAKGLHTICNLQLASSRTPSKQSYGNICLTLTLTQWIRAKIIILSGLEIIGMNMPDTSIKFELCIFYHFGTELIKNIWATYVAPPTGTIKLSWATYVALRPLKVKASTGQIPLPSFNLGINIGLAFLRILSDLYLKLVWGINSRDPSWWNLRWFISLLNADISLSLDPDAKAIRKMHFIKRHDNEIELFCKNKGDFKYFRTSETFHWGGSFFLIGLTFRKYIMRSLNSLSEVDILKQ